jgi:hypothetical protein
MYIKLFQKFSSVDASAPSRFFPADAGSLSMVSALAVVAGFASHWRHTFREPGIVT